MCEGLSGLRRLKALKTGLQVYCEGDARAQGFKIHGFKLAGTGQAFSGKKTAFEKP